MIRKHLQSSGTRADSAQSSGGARRDDNVEKCSNQRGVALLREVDTSELKQNVTEEKITSDKDAPPAETDYYSPESDILSLTSVNCDSVVLF